MPHATKRPIGITSASSVWHRLWLPLKCQHDLVGDGGFLFSSEALATAVQYRLNVVTVVFNDNCYSSIKRSQISQFDRMMGVDLVNPDLVKFAEAFDAVGLRAQTPDQLHSGVLTAFEQMVPTVIEVPFESDPYFI